MNEASRLRLSAVRFGYGSSECFLGPIDLSLAGGELLAVVGPNGAGKSTLLRLAVGLLKPRNGSVQIDGLDVARLGPRRRGLLAAFLPQNPEAPGDLVARDVVLQGRYPHRRWALFDSADDLRVAEEAMRTTATLPFAVHTLDTLSSGERQRVHLAAAIAQAPRLLVLDEPTTALDPYHQLSIFRVLRELGRASGVSVLVATHDLNLAGQFADRVLLLHQGRKIHLEAPGEVLRPEVLEPVYGVAFDSVGSTSAAHRWILPFVAEGGR